MQDFCCRETSLGCHWVSIYIRLSDIKMNERLITSLNTCSVPHATLSIFHRACGTVDCATYKEEFSKGYWSSIYAASKIQEQGWLEVYFSNLKYLSP